MEGRTRGEKEEKDKEMIRFFSSFFYKMNRLFCAVEEGEKMEGLTTRTLAQKLINSSPIKEFFFRGENLW